MPDTEHKNSNNIKDKVSTANVEPFVEVLTNIEISVGKSLFIVKGMSSDKILCDLSNENSEIKSLGSSPATALINCPSLNYDDLSIRLNITEIANDSIVFSPNDSDASTKIDALLSSLRKEQHIEICAKKDVEHSSKNTGFSNFNFIPLTFPELNYEDIDISSSFLGKKFSAPIFITGMTGGVKRGGEINKRR
jgi:hypothetical protein